MEALGNLFGRISWHRSEFLYLNLSESIVSPRTTILWLNAALARIRLGHLLKSL